jgi:hypothetical protein
VGLGRNGVGGYAQALRDALLDDGKELGGVPK